MQNDSYFFAYPADSRIVNDSIDEAVNRLKRDSLAITVTLWKEYGPYGQMIQDKVRTLIDQSNCFVADVTYPNFNVMFEIGYAIARAKRMILVRNSAVFFKPQNIWFENFISSIELKSYDNYEDLYDIFKVTVPKAPMFVQSQLDLKKPVSFFNSPQKTDDSITIESTLNSLFTVMTHHLTDNPSLAPRTQQKPTEAVLLRIHDPSEDGSLTILDAIENVRFSAATVCFLQSREIRQALEHNVKMAFIAGLAFGLQKQLLMLRPRDMEPAVDILDITTSWKNVSSIQSILSGFRSNFSTLWQTILDGDIDETTMGTLERAASTFGDPAAENESDIIHSYYVETEQYIRARSAKGRLVIGRKGSGKTALFFKLRHYLSYKDRGSLVLGIAPVESQLVRFKEDFIKIAERGVALHTFEAIWQGIILVELGRELIRLGKNRVDHANFFAKPAATRLVEIFSTMGLDDSIDSLRIGDFSEELEIVRRFFTSNVSEPATYIHSETEKLRRTKLKTLRDAVFGAFRETSTSIWILTDNLDKAFNPEGVDSDDCAMIVCLLDAVTDLRKAAADKGIDLSPMIFLRSDVYELLVISQSDRGKELEIELDCTDEEILKQVVRRRLMQADLPDTLGFEGMWNRIVSPAAFGGASWEYFLSRSLMRPRFLIRFIKIAMSKAIGRGHDYIQEADILSAERDYSRYSVEQIGFELLDASELLGKDILYILMGMSRMIGYPELFDILGKRGLLDGVEDKRHRADEIIRRFTWYGVLGVKIGQQEIYIYDSQYKSEAVDVYWYRDDRASVEFCVNPAFHAHLRLI